MTSQASNSTGNSICEINELRSDDIFLEAVQLEDLIILKKDLQNLKKKVSHLQNMVSKCIVKAKRRSKMAHLINKLEVFQRRDPPPEDQTVGIVTAYVGDNAQHYYLGLKDKNLWTSLRTVMPDHP